MISYDKDDYVQGSYAVWKSIEFDFSHFQVWISMERRKERMEKYFWFQTIGPIVFFKR